MASLLIEKGHSRQEVWKYPLGFLWNEAEFARQRGNMLLSSYFSLLFGVVCSVFGGKEATPLSEIIQPLTHRMTENG